MSSGHSHSHNHGSCTTDHHDHEHSHVVHTSPADTRIKDIALWDDSDDPDATRLSKSHGLLDHAHGTNDNKVLIKLQRASLLCLTFLLVEVVGGVLSGSLAILSDASHLCADLASFAVAIGASYLASLPKTANHTFGLKRVESLAALLSMLSLAFISIALGIEAIRRIYKITVIGDHNIEVQGVLMSGIAFIGVLVNVALAFVLGEHHVHLPSDSGGCSSHDHGHSHGHGTSHGEKDHHDDHDNGDDHHHDHDDHECSSDNGDHGHDHGHDHSANEATPLVQQEKNNNHHEHVHDHKEKDANYKGAPIPFLPKNINLQAAYLHVLGDLAQSVAVLIAGVSAFGYFSHKRDGHSLCNLFSHFLNFPSVSFGLFLLGRLWTPFAPSSFVPLSDTALSVSCVLPSQSCSKKCHPR